MKEDLNNDSKCGEAAEKDHHSEPQNHQALREAGVAYGEAWQAYVANLGNTSKNRLKWIGKSIGLVSLSGIFSWLNNQTLFNVSILGYQSPFWRVTLAIAFLATVAACIRILGGHRLFGFAATPLYVAAGLAPIIGWELIAKPNAINEMDTGVAPDPDDPLSGAFDGLAEGLMTGLDETSIYSTGFWIAIFGCILGAFVSRSLHQIEQAQSKGGSSPTQATPSKETNERPPSTVKKPKVRIGTALIVSTGILVAIAGIVWWINQPDSPDVLPERDSWSAGEREIAESTCENLFEGVDTTEQVNQSLRTLESKYSEQATNIEALGGSYHLPLDTKTHSPEQLGSYLGVLSSEVEKLGETPSTPDAALTENKDNLSLMLFTCPDELPEWLATDGIQPDEAKAYDRAFQAYYFDVYTAEIADPQPTKLLQSTTRP